MSVRVVGAGLAGCEAALRLGDCGHTVELIDIKPDRKTPAHHSAGFAELVCSNSLKSDESTTASGLLKREMRMLGCQLLDCARLTRVDAGGALAVDREAFSRTVTERVASHPNITFVSREYTELDDSIPTIIATGPLTTDALSDSIQKTVGKDALAFYDAAAPIIDAATIDLDKTFTAGRYGQADDYLNCPLTRDEYTSFVTELIHANTAKLKEFESRDVFEGCMPIEIMAQRGFDALRFGPMRPVGFNREEMPYAVLQLRAEQRERTSYNLVGFQTNLTIPEQNRVFRMIPALRDAEFFRYGVMHRNTYLDAPRAIDKTLKLKSTQNIWIAGQLSGVEGYVESIASGMLAAIFADFAIKQKPMPVLARSTMLGALLSTITIPVGNFQPVNANFGILPPLREQVRDKRSRYAALCDRAVIEIVKFCENIGFQPQAN